MISRNAYLPLFLQLTEREMQSRFAGSALGLIWALVGPLILLAIYSFVFGQLFKQRLGDLGTDSYTLFVAIALWPWMMFSDGVLRGLSSIQANGNLVKKVAFPHLLLVGAAVAASFAVHLIGYIAVLAILGFSGASIGLAGAPVVLLYLMLLFALTLGVAALFAALQTLLRDIELAVTPAVTMLYFLTPVLYPLSLIPEAYQGWLDWNPLAGIVAGLRAALLGGTAAGDGTLLLTLLATVLSLVVGCLVFARLSPYFEDFL